MIEVVLVPPALVGRVWGEARAWLAPAVKTAEGLATIETLESQAKAGEVDLWVAVKGRAEIIGAATTEVAVYPAGRWMLVGFLGGTDLPTYLKDGMRSFEAWAKANNCIGLLLHGRREWGRVLGADPKHVTFVKRFLDGRA